jgi:hypothetical protein
LKKAAAIWLRPALWTQAKMTVWRMPPLIAAPSRQGG